MNTFTTMLYRDDIKSECNCAICKFSLVAIQSINPTKEKRKLVNEIAQQQKHSNRSEDWTDDKLGSITILSFI